MSPIERIIGACVDDEHMLARGESLEPAARAVLDRLRRRRQTFIADLKSAGRTLHQTPRAHASWAGTLRGAALDLRAFAGGGTGGDILRACRRSQSRLEACFARASGKGWSREIEQLLGEQYAEISQARAEITAVQF